MRCSHCKRRREVFPISRKAGGNYRRAQRSYSSKVCAECAIEALRYASPGSLTASHGYSTSGLERIVASLGTEEAAEVFTDYRERKDRRKWMREARG